MEITYSKQMRDLMLQDDVAKTKLGREDRTMTKDSGYVDNWQAGKTVTQCNLHMLTSEDVSDVTFRVGSEKHVVRAHRYVLVSRSYVFHAMFCGPLAEKGEVTIPDIEAVVFREFLRYLYTDTGNLTADNVTGLLYTSRKYPVAALQEMCVAFLAKSLSEETVYHILEQCDGYGETDLEQKDLNILTEAGVKVIQSPGFLDLCSDCLDKFLKSEDLNLKEEEVFQGVVSWTKAACKNEGISPTPENLKKVLRQMRYDIRFTEFQLEYMVNVVGTSGVLDDIERMHIVDKNVNNSVDISPFKSGARRKKVEILPQLKSPTYVPRFTQTRGYFPCSGNPEAVSFKSSKNISLVGCQLYGPKFKYESTFSLSILLYDDQDQVIAQPLHNTTRKLIRQGKLNDVMFPDPVALVAGRTYSICVTMSGEGTYRGYDGGSSVTVDEVTFTFSNSKYSTNTTVESGQIPGLIWR